MYETRFFPDVRYTPPLTLVYGLAGEVERTREESERVEHIEARTLARVTERNQISAISGCSFVLGLLARERRDWDEAETALGEAVAINRRYTLPWDEAKTLYEWGRTYQRRDRIGDREQARSKLAAARKLFESVDAARDVQEALAVDL